MMVGVSSNKVESSGRGRELAKRYESLVGDRVLDWQPFRRMCERDGVSPAEVRAALRTRIDTARYEDPARRRQRHVYVECLAVMHNQAFYDHHEGRYRLDEFLDDGEREFGGYDTVILWQSFPQLGIDDRNQFDFYRDMPGGIDGIAALIERCHERGVRVLLNYNPWDIGTRREPVSDAEAFVRMLKATRADGVYFDTVIKTRYWFSMGFADRGAETWDPELLDLVTGGKAIETFIRHVEAALPEVVFDLEHDCLGSDAATYMRALSLVTCAWNEDHRFQPPLLPLSRWLEPRRALLLAKRSLMVRSPRIAECFFHGYGLVVFEDNFGRMRPWCVEDRDCLKRCVRILRAYSAAFTDLNWQAYVETAHDDIHAHRWSDGTHTVYTLFNSAAEAYTGCVLSLRVPDDGRVYDLWHDRTALVHEENGLVRVTSTVEGKSCGCLVVLPAGARDPELPPIPPSRDSVARRPEAPCMFEPRPVARVDGPARADEPPMRDIPGGRFIMVVRHEHRRNSRFCRHAPGEVHEPEYLWLTPYQMDRYEVTNAEYRRFLVEARYAPKVMKNFLKHWTQPDGAEDAPWLWTFPEELRRHPVVYLDLDDARAYARWAGKRLPTEAEWQFAAQGRDGRPWPWGREADPARCNGASDGTTPVDAYPDGAGPFGCEDLCGNVWEWTESERDDGRIRDVALRGGCFFRAEGSDWYHPGGAQGCEYHLRLGLMYPGVDRAATIGFRCVRDR